MFQKFESDRDILKQQKRNPSAINFSQSKSKSKEKGQKSPRYEEEDEYGDDFEEE